VGTLQITGNVIASGSSTINAQSKSLRDMLFALSKRSFYSVSILAASSVVLFILYVVLINQGAGIAGGFVIAIIVSIWAITAAITLPIMAICQRNLNSKIYLMNYLIAFVLALIGFGVEYGNGRSLYFAIKFWPNAGDWLLVINSFSALFIGVLALITSGMLLLRKFQTPSFFLAILILTFVAIVMNVLLRWMFGMYISFNINISTGLQLLPMALVVASYFFVKRQFAKNEPEKS
jgi:hypothetical protein